jgi:RecG-like helicase
VAVLYCPTNMDKKKIWKQIEKNSQEVAERNELVAAGEQFELTADQGRAIEWLNNKIDGAARTDRLLLKAPTGAGKTEVFLRVSIHQALDKNSAVVILIPTRDLARQQALYFEERVAETGLEVAQMHGGIPPRQRTEIIEQVKEGKVRFVVASAMLLQHRKYRGLLESAALIVVDDVNAFDEEEDLQHLRGLKTPVLYTTATPSAVERFLKAEKAFNLMFEMKEMPFDSPPTVLHEIRAKWNENIFSQIDMGMDVLRRHIEDGSRIFIISKTRARVPVIGQYVRDRFGVPVSILHGDMADSKEHRKRMRGKSSVTEDRVSMMKQFRENKPAILVATNLVGSGLDVPMADMVLVTDADHFGEAEIEQLMGRVGRRERESDAVLLRGTTGSPIGAGIKVKANTRVRKGKVVHTFQIQSKGRRNVNRRRIV